MMALVNTAVVVLSQQSPPDYFFELAMGLGVLYLYVMIVVMLKLLFGRVLEDKPQPDIVLEGFPVSKFFKEGTNRRGHGVPF